MENLVLIGEDAISGIGNVLANNLDGAQNSAANVLSGKAGNDIYWVGEGDTVIEAVGEGTVLVNASVSFTLGDNLENLSLLEGAADGTGNALANTITGNSDGNTLDGQAGADIVKGGDGDNVYIVDLTVTWGRYHYHLRAFVQSGYWLAH